MLSWMMRRWWIGSALIAVAAFWLLRSYTAGDSAAKAREAEKESDSHRSGATAHDVRVDVVKPRLTGLERSTTQPASIHAFDFAELYSKVSGYLQSQLADIGDQVKKGQVLAEIEAPELVKEVDRAQAVLLSAQARLVQAKAGIAVAEAAKQAAEAMLQQSRANVKRDGAAVKYRDSQHRRISELWRLHSIDEQLVDEKEDQLMAAQASLDASNAAVITSQASIAQAQANIEKAKADANDAEAEMAVAEAALEKANIFTEYLKIKSPYDGVVSQRAYHVGDFIREATQGATLPLFTVTRTDKMRVIVQIPDRDVPYTHAGDPATVEVDALPGIKFQGAVSRIANSEDSSTRTMRTEVDIPNPENRLRDGMYGQVDVLLQEATAGMTIPSSCIVGELKNGHGQVYVVKNGQAHLVPVVVGQDNGIDVEVTSGLAAGDLVVRRYNGAIADGAPVNINNAVAEVAADDSHS